MGYWGKVIGGMAGFAMGGPFGAAIGAALGHAADSGVTPRLPFPFSSMTGSIAGQAKVAAALGHKQQLFSIAVVALSAKLAKCDGPVKRAEIDAFRRQFRIPDNGVRDIGRLFDQARDSSEGFESYAKQLGDAFSDNRGMLEDVLGALFGIARADGPINQRELEFLSRVHRSLGLDRLAWDRAQGLRAQGPRMQHEQTRRSSGSSYSSSSYPPMRREPDAYEVLGVARSEADDVIRQRWKQLMRENHPDSLAARGVPPEFIASASDKVARINAAWDIVKRERGL
jgi:DnaJ like chaperone protein